MAHWISVVATAIGSHLTVSLIAVVVILCSSIYLFNNWNRRFPPGPWNLPFFGYLPWIAADADKTFASLGKKYGNVFRLRLGFREIYILNDYEAIKAAMVKNGDVFAGRQQTFNLQTTMFNRKGILVEDGEPWKEQRRFAISSFRDVGFGKISFEDNILTECQRSIDSIAATKGKEFNIQPILANSITGIICSLTFGKIFDYDDPIFAKSCEYRAKVEALIRSPYITLFPWLRFLPASLSGMDNVKDIKSTVMGFISYVIDDHKKSFDEHNIRDFLDLTLKEIARREKLNPNDVGTFDIPHLRCNLLVFFLAGVNTTVRTLEWSLKFLTDHPQLQQEIQRELDAVVGRERLPSSRDRPLMPFTEAFIYETQRAADLIPYGVPHTNLVATKLLGYDIPKRSLIIANLRAAHQDPKLWKDPENFRPSRFLDGNNKIMKPDYLMPFGIGKRICMGESLAKMELFLFITALLQRFTFERVQKGDVSLEEGVFQRALKPFGLRATPRS